MTKDTFFQIFAEEYHSLTGNDISPDDMLDFYDEGMTSEEEVRQSAYDLVSEIRSDMAELRAGNDYEDDDQSRDIYEQF